MKKVTKIILVCAVAIVAVGAVYLAVHTSNINSYDRTHQPTDTHDVNLFVNYSDAGNIPNTAAKIKHGKSFVCTVIQTSAGYVFEGWFEGNTLVSKSKSFSYTVFADADLEARFYKNFDGSFVITQDNIKTPMNMTLTPTADKNVDQRVWSVYDVLRGKPLATRNSGNNDGGISFTVTQGGPYILSLTTHHIGGSSHTQTMTIVINQDINKTFEWRYQEDNAFSGIADLLSINDGAVTWNVTIPFTEWYEAKTETIPRNGSQGAYDVVGKFITTDSQVIASMAEDLETFSADMSDLERVQFILKFVQSIPYEEDRVSEGMTDYWKFPIETIYDGNGDCEDHAILLATMLKLMGYKVAIFHVYVYNGGTIVGGHIAVGVANIEGASGYSVLGPDGLEYYYAEGTAEVGQSWLNQADLGFKPDGFEVVTTWLV